MIKYIVTLTNEEREYLLALTKKGKHKSSKIRNAFILLNCDRGESSQRLKNEEIVKVLQIGARTIDTDFQYKKPIQYSSTSRCSDEFNFFSS